MLLHCLILILPFTSHALSVMIDPGHGGSEHGAVYGHIREADLALSVGKKLQKILIKDRDFSVFMTRTEDHHLSLDERVRRAENEKVDLFLSLHANSSPEHKARGVELYFQNSLPADEEALYLAHLEEQLEVQQAQKQSDNANAESSKKADLLTIVEDLKKQDRQLQSLSLLKILSKEWKKSLDPVPLNIKQGPFYVLSKTRMPAILIEIGFMTHPKEILKLKDPNYQTQIAENIFRAIKKYASEMKLKSASSQNLN